MGEQGKIAWAAASALAPFMELSSSAVARIISGCFSFLSMKADAAAIARGVG